MNSNSIKYTNEFGIFKDDDKEEKKETHLDKINDMTSNYYQILTKIYSTKERANVFFFATRKFFKIFDLININLNDIKQIFNKYSSLDIFL